MRIVAGTLKGRVISAPKGSATRPTADRVREALFSALVSRLGSDLAGASVLDAFAGSGALGLEALSRGAKRATFVERDPVAVRTLRSNIVTLDMTTRSTVVVSDVHALTRRNAIPGAPFSLLFLDPPYRIDEAEVRGLIDLLAHGLAMQPGALIVWEHDATRPAKWPEGIEGMAEKRYGSTAVSIGEYMRGETA